MAISIKSAGVYCENTYEHWLFMSIDYIKFIIKIDEVWLPRSCTNPTPTILTLPLLPNSRLCIDQLARKVASGRISENRTANIPLQLVYRL